MTKVFRRILQCILWIVLIISVVLLLFGNQIKGKLIQNQTNKLMDQKVEKVKKTKGTYDFQSIKEVSMSDVLKAHNIKDKPIGKISIPAVDLKLPLFQGLDNEDMTVGACTMKSGQIMGGMNNYAIAGHHMKDPHVLFSPLAKIKVNDKIYLTDTEKVYIYQVSNKMTVNKSDTSVINDVPGERMITLVTCASGNPGEENRIIVQGRLVNTEDYQKDKQLFE